MKPRCPLLFCTIMLALAATRAGAQQQPTPWGLDCDQKMQDGEHFTCNGHVVFQQGDVKLYANELEWFRDEDRAVARGNVLFSQGRNQISADHADLNTKTRLGTFYVAAGFADSKPPRPTAPVPGGFVAPQMVGQDTDVYFFGDVIEKVGAKKYIITNGGFTTCVQPTPRWDLHAGKITLNVDAYTLAHNAIFNVKGVPVLYLPILYYPTHEDGRATGFLLPTFGTSTLNGNQLGDQFFWAIDRSQDATFMYDWYSKLGKGVGSEYRYNIGSGAGNVTGHVLDRTDGQRNISFLGSANQALPHRFRASANANYFSSVSTNQLFQSNLAAYSQSTRTYGSNLTGAWGHYSFNGTFTRTESFSTQTSSSLSGSTPILTLSQGERPLFASSPIFFSFGSEYAHVDRETKIDDLVTDDRSLSRIDFTPRVRYPFKRWPFLTVNSSISWRDTFYTRSQDPLTSAVLDDNLNRRYFTLQSDLTGPVFNRVWDTPNSGYAEKFKHTIEPSLTVQRITAIDNFNRLVSGIDQQIAGGTTNLTYGVINHLYAKRKIGSLAQSQEIASLGISQTYYTNSLAAQFDTQYGTGLNPVSRFSGIRIDTRVSPITSVSGGVRAEIDPTYLELRTLSGTGHYGWSRGSTDVTWSQRFFVANQPGYNDLASIYRTLDITSSAHRLDNRYGGNYRVTYDAVHSTLLQQTIQAYYSAQCCGFSLQYARSNRGTAFPADTKFMFSFTLAGLGSFSPFDGGLSGGPR